MDTLLIGFSTGLSLILALGAQNIFVIEQGLKKNNIFIICLICSLSDLLLIFSGIFLFYLFQSYFNNILILILNVFLIIFLIHFIYSKISNKITSSVFTQNKSTIDSLTVSIFKTLGFTFLNPHVYSDTVFFLGNFSKSMTIENKINFGLGASMASFFAFFLLGYGAQVLSPYINNRLGWKIINYIVCIILSILVIYILYFEIFLLFLKSQIPST